MVELIQNLQIGDSPLSSLQALHLQSFAAPCSVRTAFLSLFYNPKNLGPLCFRYMRWASAFHGPFGSLLTLCWCELWILPAYFRLFGAYINNSFFPNYLGEKFGEFLEKKNCKAILTNHFSTYFVKIVFNFAKFKY